MWGILTVTLCVCAGPPEVWCAVICSVDGWGQPHPVGGRGLVAGLLVCVRCSGQLTLPVSGQAAEPRAVPESVCGVCVCVCVCVCVEYR